MITGYFSVFAQTGLEQAGNHFLDGSDARLATSDFVDKLIGKHVPGGTVEATVDVKAQRAAYDALVSSGARRAAAVVLDAGTGAVRVMASTPSYDPNDVSALDREKAVNAFNRLSGQKLKPLLNKATGELFPPGSTFKTGTADVEGAAYNDRWFIGFGPRENPGCAVAVMTEAPGYGIKSGPIAARIIDALGG